MTDKALMSLDEIRDRLDLGDTQMLEWLATRANLVREVARIKEAKGASLQAADREASMFARKQIQCRVLGLDFDYVAELVSLMIWHSKQIECDELGRDTFLDTEPVPPARLHAQLLELTAAEAPRYDEYCRGEDADAVSSYIDREFEWIEAAAGEAPDRAFALDLGCATGQVAEFLQSRFERVRGFDISPSMIEHARGRCDWNPGVELEVRDLDAGIPAADGTVSFAVANFGAASELAADLPREIARVLRPGGVALLSWYNRDALVNDWFYPWPSTVHSHLNPHNDTLEVWSGRVRLHHPGAGHDGGRSAPRLRIGRARVPARGHVSDPSADPARLRGAEPPRPCPLRHLPAARRPPRRPRHRPGQLHHRGRVPAEALGRRFRATGGRGARRAHRSAPPGRCVPSDRRQPGGPSSMP